MLLPLHTNSQLCHYEQYWWFCLPPTNVIERKTTKITKGGLSHSFLHCRGGGSHSFPSKPMARSHRLCSSSSERVKKCWVPQLETQKNISAIGSFVLSKSIERERENGDSTFFPPPSELSTPYWTTTRFIVESVSLGNYFSPSKQKSERTKCIQHCPFLVSWVFYF